ncbi:DNA segregation ATPase, FtsK/SpoIIIE family [Sphaerochaeta pleomorpha str. Grapes]|uniref:DNA segregation ATPase, FtsK/SpoIIIE family n=1 Tax=Sphaerochaeta pleomorpha (strain ATCC BAA-1885 / DSM 22778 / Grapes) TaxID=158190 RepID=G8QSN5_SPHPG|nr:DNA translocase FtsK [Sphaerochaeta pleomorpha]AEV28996.1 DNA segregation ATPase, FtsK/SpoIIIE family [Sphaerochaeta pleomorpha str. Grapes]
MNKGKGRFSLVFGFLSLFLAMVLSLGIVLPLFSVKASFLTGFLQWLAPYIGFSALANPFGLIPFCFLLILWACMAFSFRGRKPFSFVLIPVTALMYFTVYLLAQMLQQTGRPKVIMDFLFANGATLHTASLKVVLAFLFETGLFVALTLIGDILDRHYRKKKAFALKLKQMQAGQKIDTSSLSRGEKRRLASEKKRQEKLTEDEAIVVLKQKQKPEEKDFSGKMEFPQVMEVPPLNSLARSPERAVANKDIIDVEELAPTPSYGLASIGALQTIKEEHMRERKVEKDETRTEKKKAKSDERKHEPLSGFLQAALEVIGKNPAAHSEPVPKRTGKAKGMLARAVEETEDHGLFSRPETPASVTIANPVEVKVSMGSPSLERREKESLQLPAEESGKATISIRDQVISVRPSFDEPKTERPEFFAPLSTAKPINGGFSDDVPPISEVLEGDLDIDTASGVGGLASSNGSGSALINKGRLIYRFPPEEILVRYPKTGNVIDTETLERGDKLVATLMEFNVRVELVSIVRGPTVTMFEILPAPGVRVNTIVSLADNIALSLAALQVRIVAPIPGRSAVGIEIPNRKRDIIGFKEMLPSMDQKRGNIPMVLGKNLLGEPIVIDVEKAPHLLIAGSTGSGKSVCVNSMICSILFRKSPKEVRLILVDPKIVELNIYNGIPHLLTPVITDPKKTLKAFDFCLYEMDRRYRLLQGINARNITGYNEKIEESHLAREKLPFIVVVIDEFADLMHTVGKELENKVSRLAAMSRAVGIHLILATQRPSVDVITGVIKSNIPTRIAFAVTSTTDSRIIIDEGGAEKLLGKGDMLYVASTDPIPMRIQGAYLSDNEVEEVVRFASTQGVQDFIDDSFFEDENVDSSDASSDEVEGNDDDALMEKALQIVVERRCASASYLQRRLKIGYNRAARLVEQMEEMGYVGPPNGSKPRELIKYPS